MFIGTFGLRITSIYVISGILLGMVGGFILGKMKLEPYLSDWVKQIQQNSTSDSGTWEKEHTPFFRRLPTIMQEAWGIVRGVLLYILIGIGIGAFMHGYVPEGFFEQYMSKDNWFAVPLSVVLAVPMYANAAGIVPVIEVFVAKGIPHRNCTRFYDGGCWAFTSRSHVVKESNDMALDWYFLWIDNLIYHRIRLSL